MHGHKPKFVLFLSCFFFVFCFLFFFFAIARSEFASCSFPVLFLAPFTLATFCVSYFFLAAVKSWVLIMGKVWKWDLVYTKTVTLFFNLLRQNAVDLVLLCYLIVKNIWWHLKLMTSEVVQKARPLSTHQTVKNGIFGENLGVKA